MKKKICTITIWDRTGLIGFLKTIMANVYLDCDIDLIFIDVLTLLFVSLCIIFIAAANFLACSVLVKHITRQ